MPNRDDNRVLSRIQARELTQQEVERVNAGRGTALACTFEPPNFKDGECA